MQFLNLHFQPATSHRNVIHIHILNEETREESETNF